MADYDWSVYARYEALALYVVPSVHTGVYMTTIKSLAQYKGE